MGKYVQTFVVEGALSFPFDMLRYDYCYPADSESAANMDNNDMTERTKVRLRRCVDLKGTQPTIARWESFGWNVDKDSIQTRKL